MNITVSADDAGKKVSTLVTVPDGQEIDTVTINGETKTANTKVAEGDEVVVTFKDVASSDPDPASDPDTDSSSEPASGGTSSNEGKDEEEAPKKKLFCDWDFI